jgi:hypothetical protein
MLSTNILLCLIFLAICYTNLKLNWWFDAWKR